MSLSPLYPSLTNDLHVSIATSFHQSFLWLHPNSGIVHHLSGLNRYAITRISPFYPSFYKRIIVISSLSVFLACKSNIISFSITLNRDQKLLLLHFHYAFLGFIHPNTRISGKLLGPCFKTGQYTVHYLIKSQFSFLHDRADIRSQILSTLPLILFRIIPYFPSFSNFLSSNFLSSLAKKKKVKNKTKLSNKEKNNTK